MMGNEELSVIIWCWPDLQTNATQLRVVSVATGEEVHFNNGTFLLRITIGAKASVTRCHIRHMASGREAYMQGGQKLRTFVKDCLLNSKMFKSTPLDASGE
ncbi:MAG: hypothetical protein AUF65_00100 [Chloroflexi bacterium 13_1_20CM_50_12]|nr:MAG: hypothetical protein AUF65_00100 [Chloroflexi bacterium 13_1_20CM_50_12]